MGIFILKNMELFSIFTVKYIRGGAIQMKKIVFSLILWICMIPAFSVSAEMMIQVDYGLNGQGKQDKPITVTITIENDAHAFEGELLTTYPNSHSLQTGQVIPLTLKPYEKFSESFVIGTYPYQLHNDLQEPFISVYEGTVANGQKYEDYKIVDSDPKLYSYDSHVIGIISQNEVSKALQKLRAIEGNGLVEVQQFPLEEVQKVQDARQLTFLNTIVLTKSLTEFNDQQLNLFIEWMKDGGQLIVDEDVSSTPLKSIATLKKYDGQTILSANSLEKFTSEGLFNGDLSLVKTEALENTNKFEMDGQLLAAKRDIGKGTLIQTTFSLTDSMLLTSDGYANLLAKMLDLSTPYYSLSPQDEMVNTVVPVNELFPAFEFSIWRILVVLVIYILLISPILYFVLKKKDKREYAWGLIPLIAVIFSMALFLIGAKDRIAQPQLQQSAVVKIGETSQQYFVQSLLSNRGGDYQFELGDKLEVSVYGNDFSKLNDFRYGRWSYVNERGNQLTLKNVPYWNVETIVGQGSIDVGQWNIDIINEDGQLKGTVTNELTVDVTDVQIWTGKELLTIGDLKRGETKIIDKKMMSAVLLPTVYPNNLTYRMPTPDTFEEERYNRLMILAQNVLSNEQSPAIIAAAEDLSYGANYSKKASINSKSLIVQPFTAVSNFTNEVSLSEHAFQVTFMSNLYGGMKNQLSANREEWYFDPGEYEVTYRLPKDVLQQSINWTTLQYKVDDSIMKAEILNVMTNQYEPFEEQFLTHNASDYLKHGQVHFKWDISENIYNSQFTEPTMLLKGASKR